MINELLFFFSDLTENILFLLLFLAVVIIIGLVIFIYRLKKQLYRCTVRSQKDEEIKASFLTHITHAVRLPLSAINEYCHNLEEGNKTLTPDDRQVIINQIHKSSHQMFSYLNELQELSNFDGAVPALSMIEVNLAELIMSYRREILHETHRGVMVCVRTTMSPHCKATLDTTMFRQLIMHLLRLGAKRTKRGDITIHYEWQNEGLVFHLEDSGDPVPEDIIHLLFTDNLREKHITHLDDKSTIVSLNICKTIVESMRGTIEAMPREDNKGIAVTFWIPCYVRFN